VIRNPAVGCLEVSELVQQSLDARGLKVHIALRTLAVFFAGMMVAIVLVVEVELLSAVVHPLPEDYGGTTAEIMQLAAAFLGPDSGCVRGHRNVGIRLDGLVRESDGCRIGFGHGDAPWAKSAVATAFAVATFRPLVG